MVTSNTTEESDGTLEKNGLADGNYCLVAWDLDTTGSRLMDEICQIGAYTPTSSFSQYVMPYRDLTQAARRRHNIRIITIGKYRMMKDFKRGKILKTKSEISALVDFIHWLEEQKGSTDGVILLRHENRKVITPLLLEALCKYNLMDDFRRVVVGFADGYAFAENRCSKTVRYFSLRTLARILLHRDEGELDHAHDRARAIFEVALNVSGVEGSGPIEESKRIEEDVKMLVQSLQPFSCPTGTEEKGLLELKATVVRQDSFRPVFVAMLGQTRRDRLRAYALRALLVEAGLNLAFTEEAFKEGGADGVKKLLEERTQAKTADLDDVHRLLMEHFAPEEYPKTMESQQYEKRPNRRGYQNRRGRVKSESKSKKTDSEDEGGNAIKDVGAGDAPSDTTLDTTGSTPSKTVSSSRSVESSPQSGDREITSPDSNAH
ncbi:hypothetical protein J437_LFUL013697 [Ladona fulva]|uniref:Maternal protein exuperantia n=1 Tax=Ladona fulva TaxID=123851 RepID=A0A8K0KGN3_LADFU|nr:hypothetical protein J437_LFUL013697 [Ladona fulva]